MADRLTYRPSEAFEAIGVSRSKGYEMIAAGELPVVSLGGCTRVPVAALKKLIARKLKEQSAPAARTP